MNPFEKFIVESTENEMTRSFSFDLSNCASSLFQQNTQISSISNAIEMNPARMIELLGYHAPNNKQTQKLETIYENVPSSIQNTPLNFHMKSPKEQKTSDKKILSMHGSISSWNL